MTTNHMVEWLATQTGDTYGNFINGEWIQSQSNKTYPIYICEHLHFLPKTHSTRGSLSY